MNSREATREMLDEMPVRWKGVIYSRINAVICRKHISTEDESLAEKRGGEPGAIVQLELLRDYSASAVEIAPAEEVEVIPVDVV